MFRDGRPRLVTGQSAVQVWEDLMGKNWGQLEPVTWEMLLYLGNL